MEFPNVVLWAIPLFLVTLALESLLARHSESTSVVEAVAVAVAYETAGDRPEPEQDQYLQNRQRSGCELQPPASLKPSPLPQPQTQNPLYSATRSLSPPRYG